MIEKRITCPYCYNQINVMFKEDGCQSGEVERKCPRCNKPLDIIWDFRQLDFITARAKWDPNKNPILIDGEPPSGIMGFQNSAAAVENAREAEAETSHSHLKHLESKINYKPQKTPKSSFQIRSISGECNYDFKGEIGMTGLNGPFIAKRLEVCCNSKNASVTFYSYRNAKKAPIEIHGKKEDVRDLLWRTLKELCRQI